MKYFFAGIKREEMTLLAILLSELGYDVVGYEDEEYENEELSNRDIIIYNNIVDLNEDCIVVYLDLEEDHRVFLKAKELNLKVYSYDEMISKIVKKYETICISGIHGKTTTANILREVLNCSYIIDNCVCGNKESDKFIYEEDNLKIDYEPEYVVITSMEIEDISNYSSVDDMINEYQEYANKASKMVIACGDDPYTHTLEVNNQIFYYGLNDDNDITAREIEYKTSGTSFDVYVEDEYYGHFDLPIYGKQMLLNFLAAISICHYERLDAKEVAKKLKDYDILKEKLVGDNVIINCFAKDEIELKALIKSIKQKYPEKDIYIVNSVFEELEDIKNIRKNDVKNYKNSVIIELK